MTELEQEMKELAERFHKLDPKQMYKAIFPVIKSGMRRMAKTVTDQALSTDLDVDPTEFKKRSIRGRANKYLEGGFVTAKAGNQYMGLQGQYRTRYSYKGKNGKRTPHRYTRYKPIAMWATDGTRVRSTHAGKNRGEMPSRNFFYNSAQLTSEAEDRITAAVIRRINRYSK